MSTRAGDPPFSAANAEAIEAWDGPLFDRFMKYRHIVVAGLKQFGDEAMRVYPPPPGGRARHRLRLRGHNPAARRARRTRGASRRR